MRWKPMRWYRGLAGCVLIAACVTPPQAYVSLAREPLPELSHRYWVSAFRDVRPEQQRRSGQLAEERVRSQLIASLERIFEGASVVAQDERAQPWQAARADALAATARERGAAVLLVGELFAYAPAAGLSCTEVGFAVIAYSAATRRELWRAQVGEAAPPARCNIEPELWADELADLLVSELASAVRGARRPTALGPTSAAPLR